MVKEIGFFGGSFNPVHFGHINFAIEVLEKRGLHEIIFCPAYISPFKQKEKLISPDHRLEMLKLALENLPNFSISTLEIHRQGISYTIDTLKSLNAQMGSNEKLHLMMASDLVKDFHRWKNAEEIVKIASPLIGARELDRDLQESIGTTPFAKAFRKGFCPIDIMEVSSTKIRQRLSEQKYCEHLLPSEVLNYIQVHKLYDGKL